MKIKFMSNSDLDGLENDVNKFIERKVVKYIYLKKIDMDLKKGMKFVMIVLWDDSKKFETGKKGDYETN